MLTKRQLEEAAKCERIKCIDCSMGCLNAVARTALAYRAMLEQLTEELRDCFDNGVFYGRLVGSLEKKLNEAEALLKKSECEHNG